MLGGSQAAAGHAALDLGYGRDPLPRGWPRPWVCPCSWCPVLRPSWAGWQGAQEAKQTTHLLVAPMLALKGWHWASFHWRCPLSELVTAERAWARSQLAGTTAPACTGCWFVCEMQTIESSSLSHRAKLFLRFHYQTCTEKWALGEVIVPQCYF